MAARRGAMLHIAKLAVGIRDLAHLREVQAVRAEQDAPLRHRTRNFPRRAGEVAGQGSLFWVVCGIMSVRQPITAVATDAWPDGSRCAALMLDPALIPVAPRPVRAFQGWRYLEAADAPTDLNESDVEAGAAMPESLRRELIKLRLL